MYQTLAKENKTYSNKALNNGQRAYNKGTWSSIILCDPGQGFFQLDLVVALLQIQGQLCRFSK